MSPLYLCDCSRELDSLRGRQETGRAMQAKWTRSGERWQQAKRDLVSLLERAATQRGTVTYSDVALHVFGGTVPARSRLIMDLLSEVDEEMQASHGIIIASLVVRSDSGIPGAGYFTFLATRFGIDVSDPETAWRDQAERVWAAFGAGS